MKGIGHKLTLKFQRFGGADPDHLALELAELESDQLAELESDQLKVHTQVRIVWLNLSRDLYAKGYR